MSLFIEEKIEEYVAASRQRWHTPGHKGRLDPRDITEIDPDFPADAIRRAECKTARLLGSKHLRYLVGGSSMGIKAAVLAAGVDILAAENSHRAIFEAAKLANVKVFTVAGEVKNDLQYPLNAEQVERALDAHPSVGAVYVTSPDYYGLCADPRIAEVVRGRAYLFCDAAHGAHFPFRPDLFPTAFASPDAANLSAHKTLPAYTQSAYLAVNNETLLPKIDEALRNLGTTSPSYLLLAGLEYAADYANENRAHYDALKSSVEELKRRVPTLENDDFSRLVVDANKMGLSGEELYRKLKARGIVAEKYDRRYVIFIVTLCDSPQDVKLLEEELCAVNL